MAGGVYDYDSLEDCPMCKEKTPHKTGLISGIACLVCGLVRSDDRGSFKRCSYCKEWIPANKKFTNTGEGVAEIPIPGHGCSGR